MQHATALTGSQISFARLVVLRSAIKLEQKGMMRRGRSATAIARDEFGGGRTRQSVLDALNRVISAALEADRDDFVDRTGFGD